MGSEKKSKKRRSLSPDSASEGESRSKKHRARDEKERSGGSKREKKEKKSHKPSKHSHHSDTGKKSEEKPDRKHHKHSHPVSPELSSDDYFSKNNEFATWLKEEKKIFFSDLSSEEARHHFSRFIKEWNKGKLGSQYYEGITTAPRTAHNWKIKGK